MPAATGETEMTDAEYARKLDELDRLLNDPDVPMEPAKVWSLLAEIAQRDITSHSAPDLSMATGGMVGTRM